MLFVRIQEIKGCSCRYSGGGNADVIRCSSCGLVRLDRFVTDNEGFYEESGMQKSNNSDESIRQVRIKCQADDKRRIGFTKNYIQYKDILDFGCGAGGYLAYAKDSARSVSGVELEKAKRDVLIQEGFVCFENIDSLGGGQYDVISLFHVLEHLPDPVKILKELGSHLRENGKIIIEVPNADDALLSLYESQAFMDFTYWECHLYLFSNKTLEELIKKAGFKISMMQQVQRYNLSNHLYWLAKGKPGGHMAWAALNDPEMDKGYGGKLAGLGIADTIMAVIEKNSR